MAQGSSNPEVTIGEQPIGTQDEPVGDKLDRLADLLREQIEAINSLKGPVKMQGRVRQITQSLDQIGPGDEETLSLNDQGEVLVGIATSQYAEIVRAGRAFKVQTSAAVAAVVAVPTTAVMLAIHNGEADGGRSFIIDRVWALNIVSTAVIAQAVIIGLVGQVREALPTNAFMRVLPLNGMGLGGGGGIRVRTILNATALPATTGLATDWGVLSPSAVKASAAATPGYSMIGDINGRIICPPGRYFAVHVLANVVGETFRVGIEWHEKQIKLG